MTLAEFEAKLNTIGIPCAYYAFPEEKAPSLPFICWLTPNTNNFAADGIMWFASNQVVVELYEKNRDFNLEGKVEEALSLFYWEKEATYLEDEKCCEVVYTVGGYITNG